MHDDNSFMDDMRSELDMWGDMWDEIDANSGPSEPLKPQMAPMPSALDDLLGSMDDPDSAQDLYYNNLDAEESEPTMLQEKNITTPNPIYPDSSGPDFATTPPVWVSEDLLKAVEDLKNKLFAVENRMAKQMGGGEKWMEKVHEPDQKKALDEIEALKQRIEIVSSTLGTDHEPSPWVVKRD